jgi:hypothetical protein
MKRLLALAVVLWVARWALPMLASYLERRRPQ